MNILKLHDEWNTICVSRLPYIEGFTNTSGGLRLMRTQQFTLERGDRPNAPNVAVVITDAASNTDQNKTIPEALAAQAAGVTMFTVGFTDEMKVTYQLDLAFPFQEIW